MFGYLRIARRALDDEARADYRAHFCAACHALRQVGGRSASLLTNYDQTVLALVVASLDDSRRDAPVLRVPCTALPFRRVAVQPLRPRDRRFLAHATLALVGAKLADDAADGDRGLGRRVAGWAYRRRIRRAHRALAADGFPVERFATLTARQASAEAEAQPTAHTLSAPTANLLDRVFAHAGRRAGRPDLCEPLARLGTALGRTVYLFDAFADRRRDRARGQFNAIDALTDAAGSDPGTAHASIRATLEGEIDAFARAVLALPDGPQRPVLQALVETLRARLVRLRTEAHDAVPPVRRATFAAQRGDCDCSCCCDAECCGADCCDGCWCDPYCCWNDDRRNMRRDDRLRRRKERDTTEREQRESLPS